MSPPMCISSRSVASICGLIYLVLCPFGIEFPSVDKPGNQDDAAKPANATFVALWERITKLAAFTGFEAERARRLVRLKALADEGSVPKVDERAHRLEYRP